MHLKFEEDAAHDKILNEQYREEHQYKYQHEEKNKMYHDLSDDYKSHMILGFSSAHFDFGKSIRKSKTMVQLQVAMDAIAKSRLQIQPKSIKGSAKKLILIFSVAGASECSMPFLQAPKETSLLSFQAEKCILQKVPLFSNRKKRYFKHAR